MLVDSDLPYLNPLLFWLRKDEVLKDEFTEKSFFMPHSDLITATEEAIKKDCPAPRALWILPQDTVSLSQREGCLGHGRHTFYIEIIVQCIRNQFELVERDSEVKLAGQFMELTELRKHVKQSVMDFQKDYLAKNPGSRKFDKITWIKDQMLYPSETQNFLATAIQFDVNIYNY